MCHCAVCHVTFGGIATFDRHRKNSTCHNPLELGLVYSVQRKSWAAPFSTQRESHPERARLAVLTHPHQRGETQPTTTTTEPPRRHGP